MSNLIDLIPNMTSNENDDIKLIPSFEYINGDTSINYAYYAFDGNANTRWQPTFQTSYNPGGEANLIIQFKNKKSIIKQYCITCSSIDGELNRAPKEWSLKGSNNQMDWVTLDNQGNINDWVLSETKTFNIDNNKAYQFYKIDITETNYTTHEWVSIFEFKMFGIITTAKYLIKSPTNNLLKIGLGLENLGAQTPTQQLFIENGFDDITLLNTTTFNETKTMVDEGVVGTGKMFSIDIDTNMIKNVNIL